MFNRKLDDDTLIRSYNIDDAPALYEVLKREPEHLLVWLPWPDADKSLGDRREFIRGCIQQESDGDGFRTGIFHRGELAGSVGFHDIGRANRSTSIGYWLAAKHQRKGIMTRACEALVDHALLELKLNRVETRCASENTRSRAIPERFGFTREGVLRQVQLLHDRYVDHVVYSMLVEQSREIRSPEGA
jgi:ribosomal-protein-serine acetyltransferase